MNTSQPNPPPAEQKKQIGESPMQTPATETANAVPDDVNNAEKEKDGPHRSGASAGENGHD